MDSVKKMVGVLEKIIVVIAFLLFNNFAVAQKRSKEISTGSKKRDSSVKALQEPAKKSESLSENQLDLKYIGKPSCYKDAPFMRSWVFHNTKSINRQWVTIIQSKPYNAKCTDGNLKASVYIASTEKGDTIRMINVCGTKFPAEKTQVLIEAQNAPIEDYDILLAWGEEFEEFNPNGSKTPYLVEDIYSNKILETHYVTIMAVR